MRLLLDTHALLWWLSDDDRLGVSGRALIADTDNDILVSVVSLWEIVFKTRIGKLTANIVAIEQALPRNGFHRLPITPNHLATLATLPRHHRDPFDHLLIAQTLAEAAVFVSDDAVMARYPIDLRRCGGSSEEIEK